LGHLEAVALVIELDLTALREARESLYYGTAKVEFFQTTKDPITKQLKQSLVTLFEDQPCKLSHKTKDTSDQLPNGPDVLRHKIWISIDNRLNIPAGSNITVTQNGVTRKYKQSGESAKFLVHQEVYLELEQEYA
jgi:hypothetical protein